VPELPEVETTRRRLLPLLEGKRLLEVRHQDPLRYRHTERARERAVEGVGRRGRSLRLGRAGGLAMGGDLGSNAGFLQRLHL
jgi:formamidopyrimidine-DNA glycosylase